RRHTRCYRDWSSDVCSSDLEGSAKTDDAKKTDKSGMRYRLDEGFREIKEGEQLEKSKDPAKRARGMADVAAGKAERKESASEYEIGRASCREREERGGEMRA